MVGNELEIEIIELFRKDITRLLSINQIAKELGKAYPYIHKKVSSFLKEGILKKTTIGSSTLCSINLQNEETIILLSINELMHKNKLLKNNKTIEKKLLKIKSMGEEFVQSVVYSKEKLFIIYLENKKTYLLKKKIANAEILTKKEFQNLILQDYSIIQNHILLYQNEKYYEIMGEIESQLKIKNSPMMN